MTGRMDEHPVASGKLSDDELAGALLAGVADGSFAEQAAIGLLVEHGTWLERRELRWAVDFERGSDGVLRAWIDWPSVIEGPASSSELRVLELVRSLSGQRGESSLANLLTGLDRTNSLSVLRAVWGACQGPTAPSPIGRSTRLTAGGLEVGSW